MNESQQILKKLEDIEELTKEAIRDMEMRLTARLDSVEDGQRLTELDLQNIKQAVTNTNIALKTLADDMIALFSKMTDTDPTIN